MYFNYLLLILFIVNPILVLASPPETASATKPKQFSSKVIRDSSIFEDYIMSEAEAEFFLRASLIESVKHKSLVIDTIGLNPKILDCPIERDTCEDLTSSLMEESKSIEDNIHSCLNKEGFVEKNRPSGDALVYKIVLRRTEDDFIMLHNDGYGSLIMDSIPEKCLITVFRNFFYPYTNRITSTIRISMSLIIIFKKG